MTQRCRSSTLWIPSNCLAGDGGGALEIAAPWRRSERQWIRALLVVRGVRSGTHVVADDQSDGTYEESDDPQDVCRSVVECPIDDDGALRPDGVMPRRRCHEIGSWIRGPSLRREPREA